MSGWPGKAALAVLALTLAACATTARLGAAEDIHAFLVAIRDDDKGAFNAHVDRAALKADFSDKLVADAARQDTTLGALAAALGPSLVDVAVDNLVQPQVFRTVAVKAGYSADKPLPSTMQIAEGLRTVDDSHVCVARTHTAPCIFTFADENGVWRLTAIEIDPALLRKVLKE
jgi:predicted small secreted protein